MTTIAARLKSERQRLMLTQSKIAKTCGISRIMWCRYERGNGLPGSEVLQAFLKAGADVHFVLSGKVPPAEEMLVKRFKACPKSLQDAILRTLKIATL